MKGQLKLKMEKPKKCKCGKMISDPKSNKTGMCSACSMRERARENYVSQSIKTTNNLEAKE